MAGGKSKRNRQNCRYVKRLTAFRGRNRLSLLRPRLGAKTRAMTQPQPIALAPVPAGMKKLALVGFMAVNGPLWGRLDPEDGLPIMGFRVEERHINPGRICHGGMMMTFADMLLGFTAGIAAGGRKFVPTIQLNGDFAAPAPLGAWVEGKGRLVRLTRNMGFVDSLITADGVPCLRANGIMKIPSQDTPHGDIRRLFG